MTKCILKTEQQDYILHDPVVLTCAYQVWENELIQYIFLEFLEQNIDIPKTDISELKSLTISDDDIETHNFTNLSILKYVDEKDHEIFHVPQFKIAYKILGG